jgi:hypothetical protein
MCSSARVRRALRSACLGVFLGSILRFGSIAGGPVHARSFFSFGFSFADPGARRLGTASLSIIYAFEG